MEEFSPNDYVFFREIDINRDSKITDKVNYLLKKSKYLKENFGESEANGLMVERNSVTTNFGLSSLNSTN